MNKRRLRPGSLLESKLSPSEAVWDRELYCCHNPAPSLTQLDVNGAFRSASTGAVQRYRDFDHSARNFNLPEKCPAAQLGCPTLGRAVCPVNGAMQSSPVAINDEYSHTRN